MSAGAPLSLGVFEPSGQEYIFDSAESLITIARPGRGKSQAHVIRNLLYLEAPAFVLDVKPEIHEATAAWRSANVGPVMRFAPGDPDNSECFNPLDFVPHEPVAAYRMVQKLVPLLVTPAAGGRPADFWEGRAAQMLSAALFDVAVNNPLGRRDMVAVVDWFSPSPVQLEDTMERLCRSDVRALERVGNQLVTMPEKVRESIFDSARRHIDCWGAPELDELVAGTTFDMKDLRKFNGTFYLCVTPEELAGYTGIVRTLFGLTMLTLREDRAGWSGPPVTFFMDEFPQLGYMREVEQMLALGRQSGLRLWLFAQTTAQLKDVYRDPDKIMNMMAVRCYMEPTGSEAHELSRELGSHDYGIFGKSGPLATPQQLMGPKYVGKVIVLEGGRKPAKLVRINAYEDPVAAARMGPRTALLTPFAFDEDEEN